MSVDLDEKISESCKQEWHYRVVFLYKNREACVQIGPKLFPAVCTLCSSWNN